MTKRKVVDKDLTPYSITSREIRALSDETRSNRDEYQGEFTPRREYATLLGLPAGPLAAMSEAIIMAPSLVAGQYRDWILRLENTFKRYYPKNTMAFVIGYLCRAGFRPPWQDRIVQDLFSEFIYTRQGLLPHDEYPIDTAIYFLNEFKKYYRYTKERYGINSLPDLPGPNFTLRGIQVLLEMGDRGLDMWRVEGMSRFDERSIAGGYIPEPISFRGDITSFSATGGTPVSEITITTNAFAPGKGPIQLTPEDPPPPSPADAPPASTGKRELTLQPLPEDSNLYYRKPRSIKK